MVSSFLTRPNQEGIREQQTDVGINTPLSLWGVYFKWIHILICYLPVKPLAQAALTPCPLFLLLPQQHRVLPLSSSSSPKQQQPLHSNTTKTFCPLPQHSNTTKMLWCTDAAFCLLPQTTKTQPLALRLLDHDLLPSTRHRTKDEDYRLQQWWTSSTEPLFKGFWKGHGLTGLFQIFTGFF